MATLLQAKRNLNRLAGRIEDNATSLKREVATVVHSGVVQATPFDTGKARLNWNVSLNSPNYDTDVTGFRRYARSGDWAAKLATSRIAIARAGQLDSIYISNALPYIGKLNRGGSPQASADYVRTAAIMGAQVVRTRRILR